MKGSNWIKGVRPLGSNRQAVMAAVLEAVEQGWDVRWPMQPVEIGNVTIFAAMDYFAIGTPTDFVRVPLDPVTASKIGALRGWILPTQAMVDAIWEAADCKLKPLPMSASSLDEYGVQRPPGAGSHWPYDETMMSVERFEMHNAWIEDQIVDLAGDQPIAQLFAGHKKDIVLSNVAECHPDRIVFYGMHRLDGEPIQGPHVSTGHVLSYYDYAHGARAISAIGKASSVDVPLVELLQDPALCEPLCREYQNPNTEPLRVFSYPVQPKIIEAPITQPSPSAYPQLKLKRPCMHGEAVSRWQRIVGSLADGIFGPNTRDATKAWQESNGLPVDGIVNEQDWRVGLGLDAAPAPVDPYEEETSPSPLPAIAFKQARNYRKISGTRTIDLVVIHTMEAAENPNTAENVASWFAGPHAPMASAHYNIDADSICQSVRENDVAFHVPGANHNGIGLEHAGYARQDPTDWSDEYSSAMLHLSAKLTADICKRHNIPVEFVDVDGLKAGRRGITFHVTVSDAFKRSNHRDPGQHFPLEHYLSLVRSEM